MITPRFSYHLDLWRFLAALIVLLSHYAYPRFTEGYSSFIREYNLGSDAVVVFFVLSGFVISFAAREKDKTAGRFAFNRLTRLYTVAIPALLLGLILDKSGSAIDSAFYQPPYYTDPSMWDYWLRGLTFSSEWTGQGLRLGSNGPYWSLSYEAAYYFLFAIMFFMRGAVRWIALALAVFVIGLKVMLLLPAWAMGVGIYAGLGKIKNAQFSPLLLWTMMVVPLLTYVFCLVSAVPQTLYNICQIFVTPDMLTSLRLSNEFLWNAVIGVMFSVHLLGAALWGRQKSCAPKTHRAVKWLAGASFSLYLVHYPILSFLEVTLPATGWLLLDHALLFVLTVAACFLFAEVFERPLYKYRAWAQTGLTGLQGKALKLQAAMNSNGLKEK